MTLSRKSSSSWTLSRISCKISTHDSFYSSLKTFCTSFAHTFLVVRSSVTIAWAVPTERPISSLIRAMVKLLSKSKTFFHFDHLSIGSSGRRASDAVLALDELPGFLKHFVSLKNSFAA